MEQTDTRFTKQHDTHFVCIILTLSSCAIKKVTALILPPSKVPPPVREESFAGVGFESTVVPRMWLLIEQNTVETVIKVCLRGERFQDSTSRFGARIPRA